MQILHKDIQEITYHTVPYPAALKASLQRIGFNFPIHIEERNGRIYCVDGHKRLSALQDILSEFPNHLRHVPAIHHYARTAAPERMRNHH